MGRSVSSPTVWFSITPSDSANIASGPPAAIIVSGGGNVVMVDVNGAELTVYMDAGIQYVFAPVRIKATGTTATGITGLYNP